MKGSTSIPPEVLFWLVLGILGFVVTMILIRSYSSSIESMI